MNQMTVPDEAVKYILFQRTGYLRFPHTSLYRALKRFLRLPIYNYVVGIEARIKSSKIKMLYEEGMRREYLSIRDYLPQTCCSVLDIGCGVAGIDVFLNKHFMDQQPDFYLLDKTKIEDSVFYDFKPKGAFYNSLDVAKALLIENAIPERCVHLVTATDNNDIDIDRNVDLVISLRSWGFHYPVEAYLEKVWDVLIEGGSLIMDVRKDSSGIDALNNLFGKVHIICEGGKFQRVLATK